ncbi:MAG: AI-2E family transporter [Bryobacteraceae bacterium]
MTAPTPSFRSLAPRSASTALIALAAGIALLYYGRAFLVTLCMAFITAFILEPFVGLLIRIRVPRALGSFVVCSLALCVVYLAGLGVFTQVSGVVEEFPKYAQRINNIADRVVAATDSMEQKLKDLVVPKRLSEQPAPPPPRPLTRRQRAAESGPLQPAAPGAVPEVRIRNESAPLAALLFGGWAMSVYEILLMASFIPFLVYFMLSWRDHLLLSFLQLFQGQARIVASNSLNGIARIIRAFVLGNTLLGLLLAIATTLVFWLFRLPYPILLGPLSGFLSLFPYIGLPLAILPALLGAVAVYDNMTAYVIVMTVVAFLHLVAMNLLYPKIVGPRVHLNPLVVTVALMFWSVLWGALGLLFAIPLTAGLKAVCDNVERLEPYGRLLGD